jgi:hypothetical protein
MHKVAPCTHISVSGRVILTKANYQSCLWCSNSKISILLKPSELSRLSDIHHDPADSIDAVHRSILHMQGLLSTDVEQTRGEQGAVRGFTGSSGSSSSPSRGFSGGVHGLPPALASRPFPPTGVRLCCFWGFCVGKSSQSPVRRTRRVQRA